MDSFDKQILYELSQDCDITATQLADILHLSIPSVNKRIARLKQTGVIRRKTILTDSSAVGKGVTAFVLVVMERFARSDMLLNFCAETPDILECYEITGEYDYLIKICAADINSLERILLNFKRNLGVIKTNTLFGLQEHKFFPIPLPEKGEE